MNLFDSVSTLPFVGPSYQKKLLNLGIKTIFDLLHHIPHRYIDFSKFSKIKDIKENELVSVIGEIVSIKNQPTKSGKLMQIAILADNTGEINIIWFNQFYLTKMLPIKNKIIISGRASWFNRKLAFFSPQYEITDYDRDTVHTGKIVGIYPLTSGISNKWLKARIKYAIDKVKFDDFLKNKNDFYDWDTAVKKIHFPKTIEEAKKARERLALNEFYNLLLEAKKRRKQFESKKSIQLKIDQNAVKNLINSLPFRLTDSQNKVIEEIFNDLKKESPMNRLLQGDVGSGKTVVSAIASFISFINGYQTVFLAPTQILANQHYQTYQKIFKSYKVRIALLTASTIKKDVGKIDIFIGTHALLNRIKEFERVALLIIDEQHKFGVEQTDFLNKKNPNKLAMTATPIPRTIAKTLFSDLDISILDEMPANRKKIKTWLVPNQKRKKAYEWIEKQIIKNESQIFVICPLIDESKNETMKDIKNATHEYKNLKQKIKNAKIGLLHGKLKNDQKNSILKDFKNHKFDILVSTSVVEVGIDIPNANIIIIEAADRFGLAQLHQLRGRVGRREKEAYCLLFSDNNSQKAIERLKALTKVNSGFELAELDLKLRGGGDLLGTRQSGFGNLKIASWSDSKLIKKAVEIVNQN